MRSVTRQAQEQPAGKKSHIARSQSPLFAFLGGNEYFTRDDDNGLVLAVMPIEAPGSAFPNHDRRSVVAAFRQ
jgi:hypothetical protein